MNLETNNRELKAFKIFKEKISSETDVAISQLHVDIKKSQRIIHNLRGGAGFFGLNDLARLGGEIEEALQDLIKRDVTQNLEIVEDEDLVKKVEFLNSRFKYFKKLAKKLQKEL